EQVQELARVHWVALHVLAAAVDLDGPGVHHDIVDPATRQRAVQPEAIAARFVAGADRGVRRQVEALLGPGNLFVQPGQVARRQGPEARLLGRLGGAGDQPLVLPEFQCEVQRTLRGRSRGHGSLSVCKVIGVLPDGDLYHSRYLAAYMVSNDSAPLRLARPFLESSSSGSTGRPTLGPSAVGKGSMGNLGHDRSHQTSGRNKFNSLRVRRSQERFARGIDQGHTRQVKTKDGLALTDPGAPPAIFCLPNPGACQLSFELEGQ